MHANILKGDNIEKKINVAAMPPGIVYEGGRPGAAPGAGKASRRWRAPPRAMGSFDEGDEEDAEGEDECTTVTTATGAGEEEDGQDEGASVASSIEAAMAETIDTAASPMHMSTENPSVAARSVATGYRASSEIPSGSSEVATSSSKSTVQPPSLASSIFERVMENLDEPVATMKSKPEPMYSAAAGAPRREPMSRGTARNGGAGMNSSGVAAAAVPSTSAPIYAPAPALSPEDSWLDMILMPKRGLDPESRDNFFRDDDRIEDEDSPEFDLIPHSGASSSSGYGAAPSSSSSSFGGAAVGGPGIMSGSSRYAPVGSSLDPSDASSSAAAARWAKVGASVGRGPQPRR